MNQKMIFQPPPLKKNSEEDHTQAISGPICRITPGMAAGKGDAAYKGGAVTSAFLSVFL